MPVPGVDPGLPTKSLYIDDPGEGMHDFPGVINVQGKN